MVEVEKAECLVLGLEAGEEGATVAGGDETVHRPHLGDHLEGAVVLDEEHALAPCHVAGAAFGPVGPLPDHRVIRRPAGEEETVG